MEKIHNPQYLLEITQEQKFTVSVQAENAQQTIELANCQQFHYESEFPPELLVKKLVLLRKRNSLEVKCPAARPACQGAIQCKAN